MKHLSMTMILTTIGAMTALIGCAPTAQQTMTSGPLAVGQHWHYEGKLKRDIHIEKLDYSPKDHSVSVIAPPDAIYPFFTVLGFIPGNQPGKDALLVGNLPPEEDGLACIVTNVPLAGNVTVQGYEFLVAGNNIEAIAKNFVEKGDSSQAIGMCQLSRLK